MTTPLVTLKWATPDGDALLAHIARVSNPNNQDNPSIEGLIRYMTRNDHWSPFEMVSACVEINTTRDIARQILRHRSFSFQEFSQRYASADALPAAPLRECRLQDTKNRQNSIPTEDSNLVETWQWVQERARHAALSGYEWALEHGIAKEVARVLLPEGLTSSRLYMAGTLRSWMHYCRVRQDASTQKEHRAIADAVDAELSLAFPVAWAAGTAP